MKLPPARAWGSNCEESAIPIRDEVHGACEMLGLDPLYVANEGKLVAIVDPRQPTRFSKQCSAIRWAATHGSSEE